jgi:hypothetical protein
MKDFKHFESYDGAGSIEGSFDLTLEERQMFSPDFVSALDALEVGEKYVLDDMTMDYLVRVS